MTMSTVEDPVKGPAKVSSSSQHDYMPHLDGLRAVALFGVFFFHFGYLSCQSGFLGVDVFLVLSGFLITRNILRSLSEQSFALRNFYISRFWRLVPSSLCVSFFTLLCAYIIFPPDLALQTAESALASMFFSSNMYFLGQAGYFDSSAFSKPLLHTWSLSLEEQFYLFWPFILAAVYRCYPSFSTSPKTGSNVVPGMVAVAGLASAALHTFTLSRFPAAAFFTLPPRVYQFAAGAFTAFLEPRWQNLHQHSTLTRRIVYFSSSLSLPIIFASFFIYSSSPSALETAPLILATALQIATPSSFVNQHILSMQPIRYIGHLTYSAYLVHWPMYVFTLHLTSGLGMELPSVFVFVAVTFMLAFILCSTIEEPLRKRRHVFIMPMLIALIATLLFSTSGIVSNGWMFRYKEPIRTRRETMDLYRDLCRDEIPIARKDGKPNVFASRSCWAGDLNGTKTNVVVLGDSFARHLLGAFDIIGRERGEQYRFSFATACPIFPADVAMATKGCRMLQDARWRMIENAKENYTFVIGNLWLYRNKDTHIHRVLQMNEIFRKHGHTMMVMGEPPGLGITEAGRYSCLELHLLPFGKLMNFITGRRKVCIEESNRLQPRASAVQEAKAFDILYQKYLSPKMHINVFDALCEERGHRAYCSPPIDLSDGNFGMQNFGYERDLTHLTIEGSRYLSSLIGNNLRPPMYRQVTSPQVLPLAPIRRKKGRARRAG